MKKSEKEFLIRVKADIEKAVKDLHTLTGEIGKSGKQAASSKKSITGLGQGYDYLVKAAGAYISLRVARNLINQADAFNVLQGRIRNATRETGDYNRVSEELYRITQDNGVALGATVDIFQRLAQSRSDLGSTNEELLELTDLVQKLGVVSGASQTALNAGLLQFGQGLSAGVFRAEEFNSIVENLPALARSLATSLGLSNGELREMVLNGELMSRDVMAGILSQSEDINSQFNEMTESVARASVSLSNSFSKFLSQLDKAANGTGMLAAVMQSITESLDNWSDRLGESDLDGLTRQRAEVMKEYQRHLNAGMSQTSMTIVFLKRQIDDLDNKIIAANKRMAESIDSKESTDQTDGLKKIPIDKPTKEEEGRIKAIMKLVAALELEAETVGKTSREIALYKLEQLGATQADLERAGAAIDAAEAADTMNRVQQEALKIYADTRTEQENLATSLARLDELYESGAFGAVGSARALDTYSRAVFNAHEAVEGLAVEGEDAFASLEAAIRGWGDEFTDTLADMVTEGKLNFKDLANSIINDLLRIMIMQTITKPLFGAMGVPGFHSGGIVGSGGSRFHVSPTVFAGAPRYHAGGFAGLAPGEVPSILKKGEEVLTRDDPRHAMNMGKGVGTVRVEMYNQGTPSEAKDTQVQFDGKDMVISIMLDDLSRGGRFSSALGNTFGLQR